MEKVAAEKKDLSAITSGTSNRGTKERGWIFNLELFKNIKKQDLTPCLGTYLFGRQVPRPAYSRIGGVEGHNINEVTLHLREAPSCLPRPNGVGGKLQNQDISLVRPGRIAGLKKICCKRSSILPEWANMRGAE